MEFYCNIFIIYCFITLTLGQNYNETRTKIHDLAKNYKLLFGVATSANQIEGAWNESGRVESIWDHFVHEDPHRTLDGSNADISCDSYHNLDRDVNMLKYLGVQFYRFSLSWPRIAPLPMRRGNAAGLRYYHDLIDKLIENNIIPIVSLNHFDIPQNIQDFGGWTNEIIVDYFENYARIVLDNFADKVKLWVTFIEPDNVCREHDNKRNWPPIYDSSGLANYLCARNVILAHARVYHLYKKHYDTQNEGMMGIGYSFNWFEPLTNSTEDIEAIETFRTMFYGLFADPIYSNTGDFPGIVKATIANKSMEQGFVKSRLPEWTITEIEYIRNTYDFLGINYYTSYMQPRIPSTPVTIPSFEDDLAYYPGVYAATWKNTTVEWLKNRAEGLTKVLIYIKKVYNNPKVLILENGCGSSHDKLENLECVDYYKDHLDALYEAVVDHGCNVLAYTAWCLMDNFEWEMGYTHKFGLFHTDFKNDSRPTKPKATAEFFKEILTDVKKNNQIFDHQLGTENGAKNLASHISIIFVLLINLILVQL